MYPSKSESLRTFLLYKSPIIDIKSTDKSEDLTQKIGKMHNQIEWLSDLDGRLGKFQEENPDETPEIYIQNIYKQRVDVARL